MATEDGEAWAFNYKSDHPTSTTNQRYHGFIRFLKENVGENDNASKLECMVDCDCPDYRYRFAYNNAKAGAGTIGHQSDGWKYHNNSSGAAPRSRAQGGVGDYGTGICKHLCALSEFLKTKIEPTAPSPDDEPEQEVEPEVPDKKALKKQPMAPPSTGQQTTDAPDPDDYSDSRGGTDTLQEGHQSALYGRMENFIRTTPQFDVQYEDESD